MDLGCISEITRKGLGSEKCKDACWGAIDGNHLGRLTAAAERGHVRQDSGIPNFPPHKAELLHPVLRPRFGKCSVNAQPHSPLTVETIMNRMEC